MGRLRPPKNTGKWRVANPDPVINYDNEPPVFSFSYLQKSYGVKDCSQTQKAHLVDTLSDMGCRTWKDLKHLDRHKGGYEKIEELRHKLPEKFKEATPIAFRFSGMAPMIGVRVDEKFYLIWIDANMVLYKH